MSVNLKAEVVQGELNEYNITQGKVSKSGIVLRPQPTNDPNEPLNWTQGQKYSTYFVCCFFTFLAFMNSSAFTVAIQPIIKEFHKTSTEASYLTDAVVPSLVADLFYFHERGRALMIFHTAISIGAFGGPFINAYIVQYAGWRWMCGAMAIAGGATFVVGFVTIRETHYAEHGHRDLLKPEVEYATKRSWIAELSLTRGFNRNESFLGNIALQITSTQTFTAAPYHWKVHSLGLLSLSGLVGAVISFVFGGWLIDFIATRLTARNAEHVEPEYRLPAMIIPAIIGPMGVLTFGLVISNGKSWAGAAVGYGMEGFGATAASNIVVTYAVDAYRPIAGETIAIVFVIRNVIACLISTYITKWFQSQGLQNAYGELVGVAYAILSLSLVMYIVGRRIRRFTSSFGPMANIPHA
ncbi:hypothetical protein SLS60_010201 [Paraconiothyrium brasiliense]|uniref:MFS transporter n=1 Tax=Paraconiothyrium brasiliense TaxID=300254 RepID=A0ABR3QQK4_9PLEO